RKTTKRLAEFYLAIHHRLHLRIARVTKNRAVAEGSRTEFHAALKPADHRTAAQQLSGCDEQPIIVEAIVRGTHRVQKTVDAICRIARAEKTSAHQVGFDRMARLLSITMPRHESCTQGAAGVARRWLHPDIA